MIVITIETTINGASNPLFHLFLMHFINKTMNTAIAGISKTPVKIIIKLPSPAASPDIISFIPLSIDSSPSKQWQRLLKMNY